MSMTSFLLIKQEIGILFIKQDTRSQWIMVQHLLEILLGQPALTLFGEAHESMQDKI